MTQGNDKIKLSIWLAGFFDGRGGFFINESNKNYKQFVVKVASDNKETLQLFDRILVKLDIKHSRDKQVVTITNKDEVKKFIGIIIPFVLIRDDEIFDFRNKLIEYELSFIKEKQ